MFEQSISEPTCDSRIEGGGFLAMFQLSISEPTCDSRRQGYPWNRLVMPVLMAVPKPLLTEFLYSSHIGEELCALFCTPSKLGKIVDKSSQDPAGARVCYDEKDILGCKVIRRVLPFVKCYEQIKSSADTA